MLEGEDSEEPSEEPSLGVEEFHYFHRLFSSLCRGNPCCHLKCVSTALKTQEHSKLTSAFRDLRVAVCLQCIAVVPHSLHHEAKALQTWSEWHSPG